MSVPMNQMNPITSSETSLEDILNTVPCTLSAQEYKQCLEQFLKIHPEEIFKVFTWVSNSNFIFKEQTEHNDLIEWFYTAIKRNACNSSYINFMLDKLPLNKNHIPCILDILAKCQPSESIELNLNFDLSAQDTLNAYEYLFRELKTIKNLTRMVTLTNADHLLNNPNLQKIIKDSCMNSAVTVCITVDLSIIKDTIEQYSTMFLAVFGENFFNINITFKNMDQFKVQKIKCFIKFIFSLRNITSVKFLEEVNNEQLLDIKELEEISAYIKENVSLYFLIRGFVLEKVISFFPNNKLMKMSESTLENILELQLKLYAIKLGLTSEIAAPNTLLCASGQLKSIFSEFINKYPEKIDMFHQLFDFATTNFKIDIPKRLRIHVFQLDPEFVQKIFIMLCEREILTNKKREQLWERFTQFEHYGLEFTNPFFTPWKGFHVPFSNEFHEIYGCPSDSEEEEVEDKIKHQELMIGKTIISEIREISKSVWEDNAFYLPSLNKIEARLKKYDPSDHNLIELTKCEHLLKWYTWVNVYLMHMDKYLLTDLQLYENVFKEIVDYSDNQMRNMITQTFFNSVLKNKLGKETYSTLISSQKNSINCLIPAIFLSKIIIEGQNETEQKEVAEQAEQNLVHMAKEILILIPRQYKDGHYGQVFVAALFSISNAAEFTSYQKLKLVRNIFSTSPLKEEIGKEVLAYLNPLKRTVGIQKTTPVLVKDELLKVISKYNDASLCAVITDAIKPFCKENKKTKEVDDLTKKDINALSRTIIDNVNLLYNLAELKNQREIWILIQGLSLLQELPRLKEMPLNELKQAIKNIFAKLFDVSDQNMQFYPQAFSGKRNEGALLTYLGKLRELPSEEGDEFLDLFKQFVRSVLSENSQNFYIERYDENLPCHKHLKVIWNFYPDLKERWLKNHTEDLALYLAKKKIIFKPFKLDYAKFIYTKIFEHQHLKGEGYSDLKEYLECELALTDPKLKVDHETNEILDQKKACIKIKFKQILTNPQTDKLSKIKVELAFAFITLIDIAKDKEDKGKQMIAINQIIACLKNVQLNAEVLLHDFQSLWIGLQNNKCALSQKEKQNHRIIFTDNYWDIFMCGTDVLGSCQRVDGQPELNKSLLSYLLSGKNKYLCVQDESGKTVGRCFIRLLWDEVSQTPVLYREMFYPHLLASEYQQALSLFAQDLSNYMGIPLVSSEPTENSKIYPNTLKSLSGAGSEYVDALYDQMEDGVFEISIAQLVHQPLICLQKKIASNLALGAADAPFPPLLMWTKAPAVSSQVLDLNVPPVSSDLVGHKPICSRMLRKDIDT